MQGPRLDLLTLSQTEEKNECSIHEQSSASLSLGFNIPAAE